MTFLILLHAVVLATYHWKLNVSYSTYWGDVWQDKLLLPVHVIFTIDVLLYGLAYGFYPTRMFIKPSVFEKTKNTIVKYPPSFHKFIRTLDIVVAVSYWALVITVKFNLKKVYLLRAFPSLKTMRLLWLTPGISLMTKSVTASKKLVFNVYVFLMFVFLLFSIMGTQFFSASMNRRCAVAEFNTDGKLLSLNKAYPIRACGSYILNGQIMPPYGEQGIKGYICQEGQICISMSVLDEVPSGILNYNNIFNAGITTFLTYSQQGWTDILYVTMNTDFKASAIFHIVVVIVMDLIMMNLLIAIVVQTYSVLRSRYENQTKEKKESSNNTKDMTEYVVPEGVSTLRLKLHKPFQRMHSKIWYRFLYLILAYGSIENILRKTEYDDLSDSNAKIQCTFALRVL